MFLNGMSRRVFVMNTMFLSRSEWYNYLKSLSQCEL